MRTTPRFLPAILVCLHEGYTGRMFLRDLIAGLTVGVIALPLAMAFGIASIPESVAADAGLSPPAIGLYTAVVAGFLISALGGSRVQIGGPTGAFIVIVYAIAVEHGYAGLATATLMAGFIVIVMGLAGFGAMIKFIPYPVTTGFTSGIAVIIFSSQIKDLLGLQIPALPAEFVEKWKAYYEHAGSLNPTALGVGAGSLVLLLLLRRFIPRIPWGIVGVVVGSLVVFIFGLDVETIGTRFGGIPRTLPAPHMPPFSLELVRDLIPEATTIAILVAIESLLSAVVADGMTGKRHKSDCELVAQGVANIGSVMFGGLPATGAIARTAANVKCGGRTPVAGIIHAVFLILVMLSAAPLASAIPLPTLAAMLIVVAWNMSEFHHFRFLFKAPRSDVAVLLTTFGLTVFFDLTIAVGVGMILASMLFIRRMAEVSNINAITGELAGGFDDTDSDRDPNSLIRREIPVGVEIFEIDGPFFFGIADKLQDVLRGLENPPRVFILRMRKVPAIDATGLHALREFHRNCQGRGTALVLSGVHAQPLQAFVQTGFDREVGMNNVFGHIDSALNRAREIVGLPPVPPPTESTPYVARERHTSNSARPASPQ